MASFTVTQNWKDENSDHSDVWEDDLLVEAYEKASKQVDHVLKRRMDSKNTKRSESSPKDKCDATSNANSNCTHKEVSSKNSASKQWKLGQFCRCVYSEDSIEYEAEIIEICAEKGLCRVKYVGYGNEEEQLLINLLPSKGTNSRRIQEKVGHQHTLNGLLNDTQKEIPATKPIPPPALLPSLPVKGDDALASMLMSWYMAGYHTGYYQAMKQRENE